MNERLGIAGAARSPAALRAPRLRHGDVVLWARSRSRSRRARRREGCGRPSACSVVDRPRASCASRTLVVEAIVEDRDAKAAAAAAARRPAAARRGHRHRRPRRCASSELAEAGAAARPLRRPARLQPGPEDEARRARLPGQRELRHPRSRAARAVRARSGRPRSRSPPSPGFVVNRLLFPYLFSAVRLHGATWLRPEAIDTCMKLGAGHPMGPLALLDFVGLDVAAAIGDEIGDGGPRSASASSSPRAPGQEVRPRLLRLQQVTPLACSPAALAARLASELPPRPVSERAIARGSGRVAGRSTDGWLGARLRESGVLHSPRGVGAGKS